MENQELSKQDEVVQLPEAVVTGNPNIKHVERRVSCLNADMIIVITGANFTDAPPGSVGPQKLFEVNVDKIEELPQATQNALQALILSGREFNYNEETGNFETVQSF